jgi:TPR repeat protein
MVYQSDRPNLAEFRSRSFDPPHNGSMSSLSLQDLPSPRAGEVPPALSPLDALAMQGRLLARRFEQDDKATGRRLSRLAPLTIQNEFGNRGGYFSSLSNSTVTSPGEDVGPVSPANQQFSPREQTISADRHKSMYPQFGSDEPEFEPPIPFKSNLAPIGEQSPNIPSPQATQGYFDIPRMHSPEPEIGLQEATPVSPNNRAGPQAFHLAARRQQQHSGLCPPKSPGSERSPRSPGASPSIRSVLAGSQEDVEAISLGGSYDSLQNQALSPSSSLSRSYSPYSPYTTPAFPRSPSQSSQRSTGSQLARPAFNFSRPMSAASRPVETPSREIPSRQESDESAYMRPSFDAYSNRKESYEYANHDTVHTPISMTSEDWRRSTDYSNHASTYTYSKFPLPRGRKLDRKSVGVEDFLNSQIGWEQPKTQNRARPPSPESPARSLDSQRPSIDSRSTSTERGAPSLTSSNSTVRAYPTGTENMSAQDHCDKGIEFHEKGQFMKSTYHFRLAARHGNAEAMFWYGLACRHGWGMRENKTEAFNWLRKAVDSGHLEVAEDEDQSKNGQSDDFVKKKQHRAQYAVAIYELGKCYMNGWGARQDRSLALRCYEIAGNWGDADALVEAGYSYAEGVGCKKDMKKAAKFYRAAEAKGVSMVGNSW